MRPVNSILIVLSREGDPSKVIQRGVRLARCFKAHIELFLCEAECAYVLEHQYHAGGIDAARRASLAKSRAWLERIWSSLDVSDLSVSLAAVCVAPEYEAVCRKVDGRRQDLWYLGVGRGIGCCVSLTV